MARRRTPQWGDIIPVATLREPVWKRQPRETALAFEQFETYRSMPRSERSISAAARKLSRNADGVRLRAKRWRWAERVEAWDLHAEEIAVRAQERKIVEMNERHAEIAFEGLRKVLQRLVGDDAAGVKAIDPSRLSAQDCARLTETLTKVERLARGSETERIENTGRPIVINFAFDPEPRFGPTFDGGAGDVVLPSELPPG